MAEAYLIEGAVFQDAEDDEGYLLEGAVFQASESADPPTATRSRLLLLGVGV